jgi:hypothetical protein
MKKRAKWLILPLVVVVFAVLGLFALTESYIKPFPYIDTRLTPQFSWDNYHQVTTGMNEGEVKSLLGEPATTFISAGGNMGIKSGTYDQSVGQIWLQGPCWQYSEDGGRFSPWDFAWIGVNVCFDDSGNVKNKNETIYYD